LFSAAGFFVVRLVLIRSTAPELVPVPELSVDPLPDGGTDAPVAGSVVDRTIGCGVLADGVIAAGEPIGDGLGETAGVALVSDQVVESVLTGARMTSGDIAVSVFASGGLTSGDVRIGGLAGGGLTGSALITAEIGSGTSTLGGLSAAGLGKRSIHV
jgi:hypothetical protein